MTVSRLGEVKRVSKGHTQITVIKHRSDTPLTTDLISYLAPQKASLNSMFSFPQIAFMTVIFT